jgi:hypothetical protein
VALFDADQWFTGLQTAVTSVFTAVAGAIGAWFALRRKVSADAAAIAEDRQRTGLIGVLGQERDDYKKRWIDAMETRLKDQEEIGRLRGLLEDAQEQGRQLLQQELVHQQKVGACDEKVRALSERVKLLQIENLDLFAEVARLDPRAAERLTQKRWNPPDTPAEQIS